jgi:hypothetical protein
MSNQNIVITVHPPSLIEGDLIQCQKCYCRGDRHFVSYTSRYGRGRICQPCHDKEITEKR